MGASRILPSDWGCRCVDPERVRKAFAHTFRPMGGQTLEANGNCHFPFSEMSTLSTHPRTACSAWIGLQRQPRRGWSASSRFGPPLGVDPTRQVLIPPPANTAPRRERESKVEVLMRSTKVTAAEPQGGQADQQGHHVPIAAVGAATRNFDLGCRPRSEIPPTMCTNERLEHWPA
jgi:hypothetical protein